MAINLNQLTAGLKNNTVNWMDQGWGNQGTLGANNNPTQIRQFSQDGQNYFAQRYSPGWDMAAAEGTGYGGGIGAAQPNPHYVYKNMGGAKEDYRGQMMQIFDEDFQNRIGEREINITEGDSWQKALAAAAAMAGGSMLLAGGLGGAGAGAASGAGAGGAGAVGSGAGFVGEGALSGIAGWDAALAGAPSWSAAGGMAGGAGAAASGGGGAGGAVGGASGAGGGSGGFLSSLTGGQGVSGLLGPAATVIGGLAGAQGQQQGATTSQQLPEFLQGPVAGQGGLIGQTQGLLNQQMPGAVQQGQQMTQAGQGLLSAPVAGNGMGQIQLNSPDTATNPYATGILDDLQRRQNEVIAQNLAGVQGNFVGAGGLGGSRQGIAQAQAISQGADNFTGQAANFMGGLYNQDQNRALQQYGMDQGFYGQQRGQDLAQVGIGAGLVQQGQQAPWLPIQNAADVYGQFSPFGNRTTSQESGGGWQGALGGALAGASMGRQFGWW